MDDGATNQINLLQQKEYNGTVKACFIHNRKTSFTR